MRILLCSVAVVVAGCAHREMLSTGVQGPTDCILSAGFRVSPATNSVRVGDTINYKVAVVNSGQCSSVQSIDPAAVTWKSSDTLVARIDGNTGAARALATGLITITASANQDPNVKAAGVLQVIP